jgi:ABC-type Fe3+/spermidine/putrescine transport system ATPase subunit
MSDDDAYISLNNVSKHFGPVVAVDHINITISGGEFF